MSGGYRLIEKPSRILAVDANDMEICGARQPYGHSDWTVHTTVRLARSNHQVIALTRETAIAHVRMLAELFTGTTAPLASGLTPDMDRCG